MPVDWTFPNNNDGTVNGIGEAGIETFKGVPYKSLAREICQNSMDARVSDREPVLVQFALSSVLAKEIPSFSVLKGTLELCLKFWKEQNNDKTVKFFEKAVKTASRRNIAILRISDFNTTGLTGSEKEYNTPWQNLVKASGVSDKGGSDGGSFGIGKFAPFACSDLRTVFYTTRDIHNLEASQGIARLVSFRLKGEIHNKKVNYITTGTGYYGETEKIRAIPKCYSLDRQFQRKKFGTDIFIIGFSEKKDWEAEIISSILDDFLLAIYEKRLIVQVEKTNISKDTLEEIVSQYKETAPMAYNYYQVLLSPSTHLIRHEFQGLGEIELRILFQNNLHRRVLISRGNGMKVFDQKNFPSTMQLAGICILKDEEINAYFREMENPQHNAWEPERHSKPSEARARKKELMHFIRETVLELGRSTVDEEMDAEGIGEFLPDEILSGDGTEKVESVSDAVKSIDLTLSNRKNIRKGFETSASRDELNSSEEMDALGLANDEEYGDTGSKDHGENGRNISDDGASYGGNDGDGPGKNGNGDNPYDTGVEDEENRVPIRKGFEIRPMAIRLMAVGDGRYRLIFTPENSSDEGYLQLKLSGEQGNIGMTILHAFNTLSHVELTTVGNKIYLSGITAKQKMSIEFTVDYTERCSMEVGLYGY